MPVVLKAPSHPLLLKLTPTRLPGADLIDDWVSLNSNCFVPMSDVEHWSAGQE